MEAKTTPACRNARAHCPVCGVAATLTGETTDGRVIGTCGDAFPLADWTVAEWTVCACSAGPCLCTPTCSYGGPAGDARNICGCWPEPEAPKATRRACRCGATLSRFELRHGLQCGACTRRDESLYGSGCGL